MSKVILITGASSGMGKDAAVKLIEEGHKVYTAARRIDNMTDLKKLGGFPIQMDVTIESEIEHVINTIVQKEGKIDVLWNNAGYGLYGAVEDTPIEDARKQFEVNLFGLASLTQKVLPIMRNEKSGTIINTSSMGGKIYTPLGAWYHATKHALEGWSDCLRLELKEYNINVVILEPGVIGTEFGSVMTEPMLKYSGNGPFKKLATAMARATKESYEKKGASSPTSVITDTILHIINTKLPKTRYRVGKWAKLMVWMRIFLGDRIFDKVIMSQIQ